MVVPTALLLRALLGANLLALEGRMEEAAEEAALSPAFSAHATLFVILRLEPLAQVALCAYCGPVTRAHSLPPMLVLHKEQ